MAETFPLLAISTLVTILNPIGVLPGFLAMTPGLSDSDRIQLAGRAVVLGTVVLAVCAAGGSVIFKMFSISLPSFQVAGGILLLLVSLDMIHARTSRSKSTPEEYKEGIKKEDVAVFPLTIPLIAGPGSIASIFLLADKAGGIGEHLYIYLGLFIAMVILYVSLRFANRIKSYLGTIGINTLTRLMGLVLAALACRFILDGFFGAYVEYFKLVK